MPASRGHSACLWNNVAVSVLIAEDAKEESSWESKAQNRSIPFIEGDAGGRILGICGHL